MAVKFLEPGGDADFGIGLWTQASADSSAHWPAASTTVVRPGHLRSILYSNASTTNSVLEQSAVFTQAGSRMSFYFYIGTLPSAVNTILVVSLTGFGATVVRLRLTSTGQLQLWENTVQIGSNGSTLSTGKWYRLCLAYTISSTTVNQFRLYKDGAIDISVSNTTITSVAAADLVLGNASGSLVAVLYSSDHYVDNDTSLNDTGDIWVTAKRPFANGSLNQFTTQIGAGSSGYGSGHALQVNERPESDTNGWSQSLTTKQTEEYSIEDLSAGDMNIASGQIIDYMGWIRASESTVSNSPVSHIIVNGVATSKTLAVAAAYYTQMAGSTSYPSSSGADIGMDGQYTTTPGTFSLFECGIVVAFIPNPSASIISGIAPGRTWLRRFRNQARRANNFPTSQSANLAMATLQDDFQFDDLVDTLKWLSWGAGGQVTVQDDGTNHWLNLASILGGDYVGIDSLLPYDLGGSYISAKVLSAGNQAITSWEVYPVYVVDNNNSGNQLLIRIATNVVSALQKVNNVLTTVGSTVAYNSATMTYFRIREQSGTTYWEYSADYITWTTISSAANPIGVSNLLGGVQIGTWQAESSTTSAQIDDINVSPNGLQVAWSGFIWNMRVKMGASQYNNLWLPGNVGVPDASGNITLSVTNPTGYTPYGAEIYTQAKNFGYGTYTFITSTEDDNLHLAIVMGGAFVFDFNASPDYKEIDISEVRYYNGSPAQILKSHVWNNSGATFITDNQTEDSSSTHTHRLIWGPDGLIFDSYVGVGTGGSNYQHSVHTTHLPTSGSERVHINAWVQNANNPSTATPTTFTLQSFTYTPNQPTVGNIAPGTTWLRRFGGNRRHVFSPYNTAAAGGNLYTSTLTATYSTSGTLINSTNKQMAATYSMSGTLTKFISHILPAATASTSGILTKFTSKSPLTATYSTSGTLNRLINKTLAATYSTSGAIVSKAITKIMAATASTSGVLLRFVSKTISATYSTSGALTKFTAKSAFTATYTVTTSFAKGAIHFLSFSGTYSASGTLSKLSAKQLSATYSTSGTITKFISKLMNATLSASGGLTKFVAKTPFTATASTSGVLTKIDNKTFTATQSASGSLSKLPLKALNATYSSSGTINKTTFKTLSASFITSVVFSAVKLGAKVTGAQIIFLTDGRVAIRVGKNIYLPL